MQVTGMKKHSHITGGMKHGQTNCHALSIVLTYQLAIMSASHASHAVIAATAVKGSNLYCQWRESVPGSPGAEQPLPRLDGLGGYPEMWQGG